ncbi:hypothetical protein CANARDRAFT_179555, partial [[Candida] arabinofermentans NRRL YB-2248]
KSTSTYSNVEPSHMEHLSAPPTRRSSMIVKVQEPPLRQFEDLYAFEQFLKDETWDNDFDYYHLRLNYLPPFIMNTIHNNLEKIKPTMNSRSKKFIRNLNHHIKRHLLQEINYYSGVDYNFEKAMIEKKDDGRVLFHFRDYSDHGFDEEEFKNVDRHWKLDLDIECSPESPYVSIDMKSMPI